MKLTTNPTTVTITLDPKEYWLRKTIEELQDYRGEWCLVHRIDMSYAGKEDQEGVVFMYLSESEAEVFRKAGFDELC